jgi:hypothetical protein
MIEPEDVHCPACGHAYGPAQVLAACTVSWPNQRWLLFTCPGCGKAAHVEVSDGALAIGDIDGAPGPAFFPAQTVSVVGLGVVASGKGIAVTLDGKRRFVPARR